MSHIGAYHLMGESEANNAICELLTSARNLRRQAEETTIPWYRTRLLKLAQDFEERAGELAKKKGPDNVRPLHSS
jgi:hypothetical protein